MVYAVCFFISIIALLWSIGRGRAASTNEVMLSVIVMVANGGYFALHYAQNLEEALLANKLSYIIACFGPMVMLLIVCDICKHTISRTVRVIMYAIQFVVYLTVLSTGYSEIFYKSARFVLTDEGGYLTKTYGPLHTVYLVTMYGYMLAGVVVAFYSINKKNVVSAVNVEILLASDILSICVYAVERFIKIRFELVPIVFTISLVVDIFIMTKLSMYSPDRNDRILQDKLGVNGRIIVDKKMRFMGASEKAVLLFPELADWELEKKIPGNGGRFNTFLRQPLREYVESGSMDAKRGAPFDFDGRHYVYDIYPMLNSIGKQLGYVMEIGDVTDIVNAHAGE